MDPQDIKAMIENGLPQCEAHVEGDGRHFNAVVVTSAFAGKSMLEQHKMVYETLGDSFQSALHALSIRTYTPDEWRRAQGLKVS